jgi:iron(III) transport system permease protein
VRQATAWMIFTVAIVVYLLFFLIPLGSVIQGGFKVDGGFTLDYLIGVFTNPIYREGLFNSVLIGLGTTLLASLIALPLAWIANRFTFPGKSMLTALLLVPMILPPFVGAIGFQQIFGQYGALNAALDLGPVDWLANGRMMGVIILQALSLYPIMYLNVAASLANIDHAMLEAAENMLRLCLVSSYYPAINHARTFCRRHHYFHLGFY